MLAFFFYPPAGDANTETDTAGFRFDLLVLEGLILKSTLLASFLTLPCWGSCELSGFRLSRTPARPCAVCLVLASLSGMNLTLPLKSTLIGRFRVVQILAPIDPELRGL